MERVLIAETPKKIGGKVRLAGWVSSRRDHGQLVFIDLRDRSGTVQVVGGEELDELKPEYVAAIEGEVCKRPEKMINPDLETGKVEVRAAKVQTLARSAVLPFDMGKKELVLELPTLLDYRSLALRHPSVQAIFKVQETIIQAFREVMQKEGFIEFEAPTIVPAATEGGAEVFRVDYYGYKVYLSQSPQLYKQMMVSVFERVYTVARAYRAEPSRTTRHLSEYISLDCEFGFIDSWLDLLTMAEKAIRGIFEAIEKRNSLELELYKVCLPKLPKNEIPRIKMREAQKIVLERTGRDNRKAPDLEPEDEREICAWALENHDSDLVFVTHYPTDKRPFYTFPDPQDPEYTLSFDLLGKGLEWMTGGQRINDYDQLLVNIKKWKLDPKDFQMYLQAFRYGMPLEGGFAIGAERVTKEILGLASVKEASLFPRDMERVDVRLAEIQAEKQNQI